MAQLLAAYTDSSTLHVASADCSTLTRGPGTGSPLCAHFNQSYYPYILYGTGGSVEAEYTGDRTFSLMKGFIESGGQSAENGNSNKYSKEYSRGFVRQFTNAITKVATITDEMRSAAPESIDWVLKGATTAVKDQGRCGSCWAYSATEGIESGLFMTTGVIMDLSEQQVISCDRTDGACQGGDLPTAFAYVSRNGGIDTMQDYQDSSETRGANGRCNKKKEKNRVVEITDYEYAVPPCGSGSCEHQKESDLMAALDNFGPISIIVNAQDWNDYESGIYQPTCSGAYGELDHAVQLVGYGTSGSQSYWKVRNSWGTSWGEDGFIRLKMGENACGLADEAMYVKAKQVSSDITV